MEFTLGPGHLSLKSSFKIFFSDFFLKFAIFFNLEYLHFNFTIFWHFTFSFLKSPPKNLKNNSKMLPYSILNSWRSICNIVYKEIGGWKCPQTMIISSLWLPASGTRVYYVFFQGLWVQTSIVLMSNHACVHSLYL